MRVQCAICDLSCAAEDMATISNCRRCAVVLKNLLEVHRHESSSIPRVDDTLERALKIEVFKQRVRRREPLFPARGRDGR